MFELKKLKLSHFFNIFFVGNILLLSVILSYGFIKSLEKLGELSNKENADNIKKQVVSLVLQDAKIKSNYYSFLFEEIQNLSLFYISDNFVVDLKKILDKNDGNPDLFPLKKNNSGFLYNDFSSEHGSFIVLDSDEKNLTKNQKNELYVLKNYESFFWNLKKHSPYLDHIWIVTKDKVAATFPNIFKVKELSKWNRDSIYNRVSEYFCEPKNKNAYWSGLHRNLMGNLELEFINPIFDLKNDYIGTIGMSLSLDLILSKILQDMPYSISKTASGRKHYFPGSFSFIIDIKGNLVVFPPFMLDLFSLPKKKDENFKKIINICDSDNPSVKKFGKTIINADDGVLMEKLQDKNYLIAFSTLKNSSWTLAVVIPEYDIYTTIRDSKNIVKKTASEILFLVVLITGILLIIFTLFNFLFIKRILIKPIISLSKDAAEIAKGNFLLKVNERKIFELSILSESLSNLGLELKEYIKNLEKEIDNRQMIETEINIALDIQQSILPKFNNDFIWENFFLYVKIYPSETVFGDFYDFFYLDHEKTKIALIMADIKGHGVPAAFYMAVSKVILKNCCLENAVNPGETLTKFNKILCRDIESGMVLSALVIFFDMKTGEIKYSNAAYNEAVLIKNKFVCGLINSFRGSVLGKNMQAEFCTEVINFEKGDKIILFTDGLAEAMKDNKIKTDNIGSSAFIDFIESNRSLTAHELSGIIEKKMSKTIIECTLKGASVMIFESKQDAVR